MSRRRSASTFAAPPGVLLETLTWPEAERVLTPERVVVLPLGAACKEHGLHLQLNNDYLIAEYFKQRVLERCPVVIAPTLPYHFYPAFLAYPGSVSLRLETACEVIVDICRCLAAYGPTWFYVLNTGVSTVQALAPARRSLQAAGVTLRYTEMDTVMMQTRSIIEQEGGSHADEVETSMMLYIAPATVNMRRAVRDYHPAAGPLTRTPGGAGAYSPSGIYGDATRATYEKGRQIVLAMLDVILRDIAALTDSACANG